MRLAGVLIILASLCPASAWANAEGAGGTLPGDRVLAPESLREWPLRDVSLAFPFKMTIRHVGQGYDIWDREIAGPGDVHLGARHIFQAGFAYEWRLEKGARAVEGVVRIATQDERAEIGAQLAAIDAHGASPDEQASRRAAFLESRGYYLDAARETGRLQLPPKVVATETFRDCADCPVMAVLPAGVLAKGAYRDATEPHPRVRFARPFAVATHEVTLGEYRRFLARTGYVPTPEWSQWSEGKQDALPATMLSRFEAEAYVRWLRRYSGKPYRVLTADEYLYAMTAGAPTTYWWGNQQNGFCGREQPRSSLPDQDEYCPGQGVDLLPAGSLAPNPFGLHDMLGNAAEWFDTSHSLPGMWSTSPVSDAFLAWPAEHFPDATRGGLRLGRDLP